MKVTDKYVFFCKGILGNWARTPMEYEGCFFFSSEQLFMYLKARLFGDGDTSFKILHCRTSKEAKDLGREVKPFYQDLWDDKKEWCMRQALLCKYDLSEEFHKVLKDNKGKTFVECNPQDRIWAIGLSEDDPRIEDPKNWKGENLLGKILTDIANSL